MEEYDVVVVGAGPSGTSCARAICDNSDKSVLILEAGSSPSSQCGGAIFTQSLKRLLPNTPDDVIEKRVNKVTIKSENEEAELDSDTDFPLVTILNRSNFDEWLLEEAVDSGAEAKMEHKVIDVSELEEGYKVVAEKENFKAEYVVGADGPTSKIGKMVGIETDIPPGLMGVCLQYHVGGGGCCSDKIVFVFDPGYSDSGYSWIFPEKKGNKVGLGVPRAVGNPKEHLDDFLDEQIDHDVKIKSENGGLVPTSEPLDSGYKGNVGLVGDALRVVDPLIGAGIRNAIVTGGELGKVIAEDAPLSCYDEKWKSKLLTNLENKYILRDIMSSWNDKDFDEFVRTLKGYTFSGSDFNKQTSDLFRHILVKNPVLGFDIGFRGLVNKLF